MPRSNKSLLQKTAVVTKALTGQSKSKIARDLKISRPTVDVILKEADFDNIVTQAKVKTYALLNDATDACRYQLRKKHNGNIGLELLKGVGILRPSESSQETTIKVMILTAQSMPPQEANAASTDS